MDPVGNAWAISGPVQRKDASGNLIATSFTTPHLYGGFFYNLRADFWHPDSELTAGDPISWLPGLANSNGSIIPAAVTGPAGVPTPIRYDTVWPDNLPILKVGETLTFAGGEFKADNPTRIVGGEVAETPGLPGVIGWAAGQVLFDSANPAMRLDNVTNFTARLLNPLVALNVPLKQSEVTAQDSNFQPASAANVSVSGGLWKFPKLSASLQKRVSYDPILQKLVLQGLVSDRKLGDPTLTSEPDPVSVLEPNILTVREAQELTALFTSAKWSAAVNTLYNLSRDPNQIASDATSLPADDAAADTSVPYLAGLELKRDPSEETGYPGSIYFDANNRTHAAAFGPGLAVVANDDLLRFSSAQFAEGYVTLVENAHPDKPELSPVTLFVIKLDRNQRYRGAIKTVLSQNVFDEKIVIKHTGDFGGNIDDVEYEWWFTPAAVGDVGTPNAPTPLANWLRLPGQTENSVKLQGDPTLLLGDMQFFCRYKHKTEAAFGPALDNPFPWQWAGAGNSPQLQADGTIKYLPQLVMGWVKRVLDRVNPYEARFSDFGNHESPATYSSLIQQAGSPPRGPVALNPDKNVIENVGLVELYQTILDRAIGLSIGLDSPVGNSSIWRALMLAGTRLNQLYTILGNEAYSDAQDPTIGLGDARLAPVLFSFQNQMATLLHEELALLRGTDFGKGWPVDNRLFWNFVKGDGEPAYVSNYSIKDVNSDGFIDEKDGKTLFPQGHGDAWGHYLSASKSHYALLRHPQFTWQTFAELYNLLDVVIKTDFLDEITFARTASAKARAGLEIVKNTYRLRYEQDADGQWQGYSDTDKARAWGVAEWATRAYHGAYFDWAVGNALMPFQALTTSGAPTDTTADQLNKIDRVSVAELVGISTVCSRIQGTLDEANNGINPLGLSQDSISFDLTTAEGAAFEGRTHFEETYERALLTANNALTALSYANELENRLRENAASTEDARRLAQDQDIAYRNQLIGLFGTPYDGLIGPGGLYPPGYEGPDLLLFQYIDYNSIDDFLPAESRAFIDLFTEEVFGSYQASLTDAQRTLFASYGIPNSGFTLKDLVEGFTHLDVRPADDELITFYDRFASGKDFTIRSSTPESNPDVFPQLDDSGEGKGLISFNIPISAEAVHGFRAEPNWGKRRATGLIQAKLQELVQAQIALRSSLNEYEGIPILMRAALQGQQASFQEFARSLEHETALTTLEQVLGAARVTTEATIAGQDMAKASIDEAAVAIGAAVPDVVGVATDVFAPVFASLLVAKLSATVLFDVASFAAETTFNSVEYAFELERAIFELTEMAREFKGEQRQFVLELIDLLAEESTARFAIADAMSSVVQRQSELDALIAEGFRLVSERELANKRLAADTQQHRYSDALLRINRNDALQRYQGAFDMAVRYAFLATKAYDYETNFDPSHPATPTPLFSQLVKTRTLGLWTSAYMHK